ncbi:hypothetical protein FB451DRAFT_1264568 [Mycena latifolia]|nr:hypothetical protein FB451DRAFT_1264568 [Mycena latifolia]
MAPHDPRPAERAPQQERALLLMTLNDPMHADSTCIRGIYDLLGKILPGGNSAEFLRQGPVLRATMGFLTAKRTDDEHRALRQRLLTCNCKLEIRLQHEGVKLTPPEVFEMCLFHMCSTIGDHFRNIGAGKFQKPKGRGPSTEPWPSCISDLIPATGGEQEVLDCLVQWAADGIRGFSIFALIGALASFWEPFAIRVFDDPDVFSLATNHLQRALDSYTPDISSTQLWNVFCPAVVACAQSFFFTLHEIDLRRTIHRILPLYEQLYAMTVAIEPRWFHHIRVLRDIIGPDGRFVATSPDDEEGPTDASAHFRMAYQQMVAIRNRNQCLHVACTVEARERLSVCSRCGIVRYCSRECLAAAWTAPALPHKALCKQIRALRAAIRLGDDKEWARVVRDTLFYRSPGEFAERCTAFGADPATAEAIWDGIHFLTEAKLNYVMGKTAGVDDMAGV